MLIHKFIKKNLERILILSFWSLQEASFIFFMPGDQIAEIVILFDNL